jgi:copper transport protein
MLALPALAFLVPVVLGASPAEAAALQAVHELDGQEIGGGLAHGLVQWSAAFLAGLPAFFGLVWLPVAREGGGDKGPEALFGKAAWGLFGLLVLAGVAELSLFAARASGEPFGPGLLGEALLGTREGGIWLDRLVLGLLAALAVAVAARRGRRVYWLLAAGIGAALLATLGQQGHAASEGGLLPALADWLHVAAAALWVGGLLGFPLLFLGLRRTTGTAGRWELLARLVPRFSRVATVSVALLVITGVYASLLYVPDPSALVSTPYGRALLLKLGLTILLLAAGGVNLVDRGRGPFDRMVALELALAFGVFVATGFLTELPTAGEAP